MTQPISSTSATFEITGDVVAVKEKLPDGRLLIIAHADEERVVPVIRSNGGHAGPRRRSCPH